MDSDLFSLLPVDMAARKRETVAAIVHELAELPGLRAVVLGGSYAAGSARADSDVDLGLYYYAGEPFSTQSVRAVAARYSVEREPVVTEFYEWGPWVNGGAWVWTATGKVDFLYRSIDHVSRVIAEAKEGKAESDYYQQPPYGFHSVAYLGETQICRPLVDPAGIIARLKQQAADYPPRLKARITDDSLWGARFTLDHASKFAARGDVYNTAGCLTRIASGLTQALFAINEVYWVTDKRAMAAVTAFAASPDDYADRLASILAEPGSSPAGLERSVTEMSVLFGEVASLAGEFYRQRYALG